MISWNGSPQWRTSSCLIPLKQLVLHLEIYETKWSYLVPLNQLILHLEIHDTKMKYKISFTEVLDLQHGEPNTAWFPCNSWFSIWRSMIRNWSFLVPLKQLVLHLEIYDTRILFTIVLDLKHGEPNAAWFPCNSWFSIWRSMIWNWSVLVPLKQLVLHLEIHASKLKLLGSPETVGSPFGDPWH